MRRLACGLLGRTPPGVRELKPLRVLPLLRLTLSRTPPGVRELKLRQRRQGDRSTEVAPLPGCVN